MAMNSGERAARGTLSAADESSQAHGRIERRGGTGHRQTVVDRQAGTYVLQAPPLKIQATWFRMADSSEGLPVPGQKKFDLRALHRR